MWFDRRVGNKGLASSLEFHHVAFANVTLLTTADERERTKQNQEKFEIPSVNITGMIKINKGILNIIVTSNENFSNNVPSRNAADIQPLKYSFCFLFFVLLKKFVKIKTKTKNGALSYHWILVRSCWRWWRSSRITTCWWFSSRWHLNENIYTTKRKNKTSHRWFRLVVWIIKFLQTPFRDCLR